MATPPIRALTLMIETAAARQKLVEVAAKVEDWTQDEWSARSRVWSRQNHALSTAIIKELPQTFDDVHAVFDICPVRALGAYSYASATIIPL